MHFPSPYTISPLSRIYPLQKAKEAFRLFPAFFGHFFKNFVIGPCVHVVVSNIRVFHRERYWATPPPINLKISNIFQQNTDI